VLHLYQPTLGMKAIVVVDNVACGPAIGGTRMAPDVSFEECFRLARAMTLKNAAAGLPHGGAKSVIFGDPLMDPDLKERELGGIPLDEVGATAFGLLVSADVAKEKIGMEFSGMRVAVQGFGAVGKHAARFFAGKGASIVAAADITGAVFDAGGLDVAALIAHKEADGDMIDFEGGQQIERDSIIGVDCDLLIPAARPDVIRASARRTRHRSKPGSSCRAPISASPTRPNTCCTNAACCVFRISSRMRAE
jgi:glutamate dehydrogenase (NAD(P)+)